MFIVINMLSCSNHKNKYREELETTQKFLKYASRNDSLDIQKLIGIQLYILEMTAHRAPSRKAQTKQLSIIQRSKRA